MHNRTHRDWLANWLMALWLAVPCVASPADATAATANQEQLDDELDEVVVTGRRARDAYQNPQLHFDMLARLVGEFSVEGYVDLTPRDGTRDLLTAEGTAKCIGFGVAPGVQCDLRVRWPLKTAADGREIPGAAPTLDPAMMLFGFKENGYNYERREYEISEYSVKHALIDNRGIFESGHGVHDGNDAVVSTSHCAAVNVDCERMVRVAASPDGRTVDLLIELTIEQHKAVRYVLLLTRVPGSKAQVFGRKPGEQRK